MDGDGGRREGGFLTNILCGEVSAYELYIRSMYVYILTSVNLDISEVVGGMSWCDIS